MKVTDLVTGKHLCLCSICGDDLKQLRALVGELVGALAYSVEHLEIAHEPPACHKCSDLTRDEHYELIARARAALKGGA
jgi:hypothetical protein